jgi:small subunit ribosomal protein S20
MANIDSQVKRNRQNERARVRNKSVRTALKTYEKRFRTALAAGDPAEIEAAYALAARKLDKAASAGVIHRNYAANHKSNMAKHLTSSISTS